MPVQLYGAVCTVSRFRPERARPTPSSVPTAQRLPLAHSAIEQAPQDRGEHPIEQHQPPGRPRWEGGHHQLGDALEGQQEADKQGEAHFAVDREGQAPDAANQIAQSREQPKELASVISGADRAGARRPAPGPAAPAAASLSPAATPATLRSCAVVGAAGAINTAAILLRSISEQHPNGLANGSGQVGRNLMKP